MREDGGRVVLMDFGAGRSLRDDDPAAGLHFLGTPSYMAPELFDLRDPAPTSDIYSVGVLMFYLLTGRFPVETRSLALLGEAHASGTRLRVTDFRDDVPDRLVHVLDRALERTKDNRRLTLVVALNYGSQAEIAAAARTLASKAAAGEINPADIDEQAIGGELQTHDLPDLDLLIRTSGEVRLSNFLLWQAAYAELLFLDVLWPDFDESTFADALDQFAARQRRFGGR